MGSRKKRRNDGKTRGGLSRRAARFGGTPSQERYYEQSQINPDIVGKYMQADYSGLERAASILWIGEMV